MNQVQEGIAAELEPRLRKLGIAFDELDPSESLIEQGVIDSLAFSELLVALEKRLAVEVDYMSLDADDFVSIDALTRLMSPRA